MTPVEKRRAKFPTTTQPEGRLCLRATSIEKSGDLLECGVSSRAKARENRAGGVYDDNRARLIPLEISMLETEWLVYADTTGWDVAA